MIFKKIFRKGKKENHREDKIDLQGCTVIFFFLITCKGTRDVQTCVVPRAAVVFFGWWNEVLQTGGL